MTADPRHDLNAEQLADPFARFARVYARARAADPAFHNAVCVASVGADGQPSARMVLLKEFDDRGFVFYTNFESRKGHELITHPLAALCFHWASLEEQVRVEGAVERVADHEADAYFASRPRGSQVGAWASHQSAELTSRGELEGRIAEIEARFDGHPVDRPPHWSGFRVVPSAIEFWIGMPSRLHHRAKYRRDGNAWSIAMLSP